MNIRSIALRYLPRNTSQTTCFRYYNIALASQRFPHHHQARADRLKHNPTSRTNMMTNMTTSIDSDRLSTQATAAGNVIASTKLLQQKLQQQDERSAFLTAWDQLVVAEVLEDLQTYNLPAEGKVWIENMLQYTIPGGKMNRGLTVPSALESLLKRSLTEAELSRAHILGWCVELLQGFFLIADDIMDASITRRGRPCWYRQEGVGMVAINDGFIVESIIYKLLKRHFNTEFYYVDLMELFHEVTYQTELGQLMDLITAPEGNVDLDRFSITKHAYIVEYKTAYYSFYLPIALAMHMAGITEASAYKQAQAILLPLGEYFQVQDDFLDCFGDPEVIGKIGTDIEDNKCGWLIVQALDRATPAQRALLSENYGQKDAAKAAIVKSIFADLNMPSVYREYEEASYKRIADLIAKVDETLLPRQMFTTFMNRIYKRKA